jgi:hypothetical protein
MWAVFAWAEARLRTKGRLTLEDLAVVLEHNPERPLTSSSIGLRG